MSPKTRSNFVALALLAALPTCAQARSSFGPEPVEAGDRIRLIVYDERPFIGRLVSFDARSIAIVSEPDSTPRTLARETIVALEVERAKSHSGRGGAIGFLAGGVIGVVVGSAADDDAGSPAKGFILGAVIGGAAGALLGRTGSTPRWQEGSLP